MDISQMIFSPWQRQAELQSTQQQMAMQQMQMAAYPEQQRRAAELQQAQMEHYKAQSEEQRALALKNKMAALQAINDELAASRRPQITMEQMASGQIPQQPMQQPAAPQQMQGVQTTPQQMMGIMGAGQAPVINAQGQYTSQPIMDAIGNNMALSVQRLNNLTEAGRVTGPLYEKTLKDVQEAGKTYADIAQKDASRLKSVTDTAQSKLDYVTQLAQVVKTPQDFEMAMRMADVSGVQWPLPRTYPEAKSFIDRLRTDSKQAVDISAQRQLEAERRAQTSKANTEQAIKKIELDRDRVIDAEAKRQSEAIGKAGGIVTAEQIKEQQKERGKIIGKGLAGDFGDLSTPEQRAAFTTAINAKTTKTGQISTAEVGTVLDQVKPEFRNQLNSANSIQRVSGTLDTARMAENISDFVKTHKIKTGFWGEAIKKLDAMGISSGENVKGDVLSSAVGNQMLGKLILDFANAYARAERGGPNPIATVAELKNAMATFGESKMSGKSTAVVFDEIAKERVRKTESQLFGGESALTVKPHSGEAKAGKPSVISSQADYEALPAGTKFMWKGKEYTKGQ